MENTYRIMIVDDERIVREAIASHISWEEHGITVAAAANALEALEYISAEEVDLMLVDIKMPVMDGIQLLKRVKEQKPNVEVIILSGYADFTYAQEALRYGARDYLLKPLEEAALMNVILKCRDERRGRQLLSAMQTAMNTAMQSDMQAAMPSAMYGQSAPDMPMQPSGTRHYSQTIQKIIKTVQEELSNEELSLKWISGQKLFLNENYLSKVFQKEVGMKFTAYLLEQRMLVAMRMLAGEEDVLILDVARASGFGENSQYFSSTFKKYTGYTPTEYKKYIKSSQ